MYSKNILLQGGDELFFHQDVVSFYNFIMTKWVSYKEVALLMGCSHHKPYSNSFIHAKVIGMLKKHKLESKVQQYIVGEPMVVVPRELENEYPASHYDFPPERLTEKGRKVFTERLNKFFRKAIKMHSQFVVFAPNHHRKIILEACNGLFQPLVVPYNVYKLKELLRVLMGEV